MAQKTLKCEQCGKSAELKRSGIERYVFPLFIILLVLTVGRYGRDGLVDDWLERGLIPEWLGYGVFLGALLVTGLLSLYQFTLVRTETYGCVECGHRFQKQKTDWSPIVAGFVVVGLVSFGFVASLIFLLASSLGGQS